MKSMLFLSILFFVGSSLSNATVNNGLYDVNFSSDTAATSSEVTTPSVEQSSVPSPQAVARAVSPPSRPAVVAASATTAAPAAPARDYTVRSAGTRADGENLVYLRSCNSIVFITGPKSDSNRGRCDELKTAGSFVDTLMRQLPICIAEGTRASGINKPIRKTKIYNANSLRTRRQTGGCRSIHYKARALDIWGMDVTFEDGSTLYTKMHIDHSNRPFYKKFNQCWERETKAAMRRINNQCQRYDGLIDCSDSDHRDHVHISLPYCPKQTGYCSI